MKLSTSALIVICWGLCVPAAQADYAGEVLKDRPVAWWRLGDPVTGNGCCELVRVIGPLLQEHNSSAFTERFDGGKHASSMHQGTRWKQR